MEQIKTVTLPLEEFELMRRTIKEIDDKMPQLINGNCIVVFGIKPKKIKALNNRIYSSDLSVVDEIIWLNDITISCDDVEKKEELEKIKSEYDRELSCLKRYNNELAEKVKELSKLKSRNLWQRIWNR